MIYLVWDQHKLYGLSKEGLRQRLQGLVEASEKQQEVHVGADLTLVPRSPLSRWRKWWQWLIGCGAAIDGKQARVSLALLEGQLSTEEEDLGNLFEQSVQAYHNLTGDRSWSAEKLSLFLAIRRGDLRTVVHLVQHHPNLVYMANGRGQLPLHVAIHQGQKAIIRFLLKEQKQLNIGERDSGDTALHLAAWRCDALVVGWLLLQGADPTLANRAGDIPLKIAERKGDHKLERLFIEQIAKRRNRFYG